MNFHRVSKAKYKDGQFQVELRGHDKDTERVTTVTCSKDKCHPDLEAAFAAIAPGIREILEWPNSLYGERLRVTGVSWSYSESTDVEGASVIFQVDLEDSNAPFCGTTPHLPFDQYSEGGNQPVMPDGAIDALNTLKDEVDRFIGGKRAQGDLFGRVEEIGKEHAMPRSVIEAVQDDYTEVRVIKPGNLSGPHAKKKEKVT